MKFILCAALLLCRAAAQELVPLMLSPMEQEKLRAQHQALMQSTMAQHQGTRAGLPMPTVDTNRYMLTAATKHDERRTQTLALVTVTVITTGPAALVRDNGVFEKYVSAARPVVISVTTNHYDVFQAPEVVK